MPTDTVTKSVPSNPWASSFSSGSNLRTVQFYCETEQWDYAVKWKVVFGNDNDLKHEDKTTVQHNGAA